MVMEPSASKKPEMYSIFITKEFSAVIYNLVKDMRDATLAASTPVKSVDLSFTTYPRHTTTVHSVKISLR